MIPVGDHDEMEHSNIIWQTLQQTRTVLGQSKYKQVPQLSIGFKELDLNQPLRF